MKSLLFDNWKQWLTCFAAAWKSFLWGIVRIISDILLGIVSIFVWLWKCAVRWVGKYPQIALGAFIVIVLLIWLLMYASKKATENGLTAQRDSIAWQYQNFKETHGYE